MNDPTGKKTLAMIHCALIPSILAVLGVCAIVLPKPTVSEYERRDLEVFPEFTLASLQAGEYTNQIERFYADTFPMREMFVQMSADLAEKRGIQFNEMTLYDTGNGTLGDGSPSLTPGNGGNPPGSSGPSPSGITPSVQPDNSKEDSSQGQQSSSQPLEPPIETEGGYGMDVNAPAPETYNSILIFQNRAMAPFGGTKAASEYYASVLNNYQEVLGDSVTIYNLIVPTAIEFYLPEKYKSVTNPQKPNIDNIYSMLNPKIKKVDAYSALQKHTDEYLYFATDHHWTALGAYYAYTAFAEQAGFTPKPLSSMEKKTISPFVGTMYSQTQSSKLLENPDHLDYYITDTQHTAYQFPRNSPYKGNQVPVWAEYAKGGNSYSVFLHGDQPLTRIDTEHKNGRKIMVVKESFGNAFAPYLIPHYEQVFVVDARYFQINGLKFIQDNGINEILFINNIFAANTNSQIGYIQRILTQADWYYQTQPTQPASSSSSSSEAPPEETSSTPQEPDESSSNSSQKGGVVVIRPDGTKERVETDDNASSSGKLVVVKKQE
jgi:hypothetical protein